MEWMIEESHGSRSDYPICLSLKHNKTPNIDQACLPAKAGNNE